jgi:hypothetical protein
MNLCRARRAILRDGFHNARTLAPSKDEAFRTVNYAANENSLIVEFVMHEGAFPFIGDDKETSWRNWKKYETAGRPHAEFRTATCAPVQRNRCVAD